MSDIGTHVAILVRHSDDKAPARWTYGLPSAQSIIDSRAAASAETRKVRSAGALKDERIPDDALELDRFAVHCVARSLHSVENLTRGGMPVAFDPAAPLEERLQFVNRLPYQWVAELANRVQSESDLDEEEELVTPPPSNGSGLGLERVAVV